MRFYLSYDAKSALESLLWLAKLKFLPYKGVVVMTHYIKRIKHSFSGIKVCQAKV